MIISKVNLCGLTKAAIGKSRDGLASTAKICFLISTGNSNIKVLVSYLHLRLLLTLQVLYLP